MKNLWMALPPLLSDNYGLNEIVKDSDGCAVIDDSGEFRPGDSSHSGRGGRPGGQRGRYGEERGRYGEARGGYGEGRGRGGRGGGKGTARIAVSGASAQDVTTGTREILLDAFQEMRERYNPSFVLFSAGPCGAMIGTDLQELAGIVTEEYHIPAAAVELTGQKTYDVGLSKTSETLAKLFAKQGEPIPGSVNILGASALDWAAADMAEFKDWLAQQGFQVLAHPGGTVTSAQLETMGQAQLNLVTTVSGLAAARYLQSQFGTPYLTAAPFGAEQCSRLARVLEGAPLPEQPELAEADALIIGEQFAANAVRDTLEHMGAIKGAHVMSFFQLDKACARKGDRKLKGEADARELLNSGAYRLIVADPLLRPLLRQDCKWIDLPHGALNTYNDKKSAPLFGRALNNWLEQRL